MSHQILDRFVALGGNFIDTANVYSRGISETIIGQWLVKYVGFEFYFCCCQSSFKSTLLYSLMTRLYRNIGTSINLHLYVHVCILKRLSNTFSKQPRKIFCNLSQLKFEFKSMEHQFCKHYIYNLNTRVLLN